MKQYMKEKSSAVLAIYPFSEIGYDRAYSISSLTFLFFSFSTAGWLWEVFLHIIIDGRFINRGVLFGPWLPIYGCGSLLILLALKRWRDQPFSTLGLTILLCGCLEYFSGLFLETFFHARWIIRTCSLTSRAGCAWKGWSSLALADCSSSILPPPGWMISFRPFP